MKRVRDAAVVRIAPLIAKVPDIFEKKTRHRLIEQRAAELPCSERTLAKDLRRFWQGGQTPSALLPDYHRCGLKLGEATERKDRLTQSNGSFMLLQEDLAHFRAAIESRFLKDRRVSITAAYQWMLETHYVFLDGNGDPFIKPAGERPTLRQFRHFLKTRYSKDTRLRARLGAKEFERNHAPKLGTVLADCLGVGHYYEIDATIVDLWAVLEADRNRIVGKPTLFLICDRASNLIAGFYLGLEHPSWAGARQAILSLAQDKAALCAWYGVKYDPEDWPADRVLPAQFLADRGEMLAKASSYIADELQIGVANLPSQSPQKKSLVECDFKLIHQQLQDIAPAYDPPAEATKRCGPHYEKDATLTVKEIGSLILEAIIAQNRRPKLNPNLRLDQLAKGVMPSPIAIWNDEIVARSGVLTRFHEEHVRTALLSKDVASVTEEGIAFRGCYYTCPEGIVDGWFTQARRKRFSVCVSFDPRLVDELFVQDPAGGASLYRAMLTPRCHDYRGLSFAEVKYFELLKAALAPAIEQSRRQVTADFHARAKPIIDKAGQEYKQVRTMTSRKARREDTRGDRQAELRTERKRLATPWRDVVAGGADVVPLQQRDTSSPIAGEEGNAPTVQQLMQKERERMLRG